MFQLYQSAHGSWPDSMVVGQEYCLGDGYPIGYGGIARCHNYEGADGDPASIKQSDNATLMSQLEADGNKVITPKRYPVDYIVGPWVFLDSDDNSIWITNLYYSTTCPSETTFVWTNNHISTCVIHLE